MRISASDPVRAISVPECVNRDTDSNCEDRLRFDSRYCDDPSFELYSLMMEWCCKTCQGRNPSMYHYIFKYFMPYYSRL